MPQVAQSMLGNWKKHEMPQYHSGMVMDAIFDETGVHASRLRGFHEQYRYVTDI